MPRAEIASKQAVYTLGLLHAELAGKLLANKREAIRLRTAMMQVEAVVKMLEPGFNVCGIAAKRSNKSNPWFKRGTLFRSAVDVLRRAGTPMTAREVAEALIAGKTRYYGANATRNLNENRHVSRKGDAHAQSRNRIETSRLHLGASTRRVGGEAPGEQA